MIVFEDVTAMNSFIEINKYLADILLYDISSRYTGAQFLFHNPDPNLVPYQEGPEHRRDESRCKLRLADALSRMAWGEVHFISTVYHECRRL